MDQITVDSVFQYNPIMDKDADLVVVKGGALTCQDEIANQRERLSPFRHGIAFLRGTIAGPGAPILVAIQSVSVFSVGVGDPASSSGGGASALTTADTNAIKEGGLVKQKARFLTFGIGVNPLDPWWAADATDIAANRTYPSWLRDVNTRYGDTLTRAAADVTTIQLFNGTDAACIFDNGPLSLWNSPSGVGRVPVGLGGMAGQFWFMATPQVSGGHSSGDELSATIAVQRAFSVPSDVASPTVAGVVAIPMRIVLIGRPMCDPGEVSAEVRLRQLEKKLDQLQGSSSTTVSIIK